MKKLTPFFIWHPIGNQVCVLSTYSAGRQILSVTGDTSEIAQVQRFGHSPNREQRVGVGRTSITPLQALRCRQVLGGDNKCAHEA